MKISRNDRSSQPVLKTCLSFSCRRLLLRRRVGTFYRHHLAMSLAPTLLVCWALSPQPDKPDPLRPPRRRALHRQGRRRRLDRLSPPCPDAHLVRRPLLIILPIPMPISQRMKPKVLSPFDRLP